MPALNRKEPILLLLGDLLLLLLSLWIMLLFRYGWLPEEKIFFQHLAPFSLLFFVWIAVFFIAGLYEKHTIIFRSRLPAVLLKAESINSVFAVLFFYFIPYFGITPKVNLFIYLLISFALILLWRTYGYPLLGVKKKQNAIIIGGGKEIKELAEEINRNSRYSIRFVFSVEDENLASANFYEDVVKRIRTEDISIIVIDLTNEKIEPILPHLYDLLFSKIRFIDMHKLYEEIFDRVPLSLVKYSWFLDNVSVSPSVTYDVLKRIMDIILAVPLSVVPLVLCPFVYIALKFEDGGALWSIQERVGQNNRPIKLIKFRTMKIANDGGGWGADNKNEVTKIGAILRKARIDEWPQIWNVLLGAVSLIGPRPEFPGPVRLYESQVPYYNVRHLIKPGLSGWAQLYHENHPHHEVDINETKAKLSYDLYYIKNRSFLLDLKIALKTMKTLLSTSGI